MEQLNWLRRKKLILACNLSQEKESRSLPYQKKAHYWLKVFLTFQFLTFLCVCFHDVPSSKSISFYYVKERVVSAFFIHLYSSYST